MNNVICALTIQFFCAAGTIEPDRGRVQVDESPLFVEENRIWRGLNKASVTLFAFPQRLLYSFALAEELGIGDGTRYLTGNALRKPDIPLPIGLLLFRPQGQTPDYLAPGDQEYGEPRAQALLEGENQSGESIAHLLDGFRAKEHRRPCANHFLSDGPRDREGDPLLSPHHFHPCAISRGKGAFLLINEVNQNPVKRNQLAHLFGKALIYLFDIQAGADDAPDLGDDTRLLGQPQGCLLTLLKRLFCSYSPGHVLVHHAIPATFPLCRTREEAFKSPRNVEVS